MPVANYPPPPPAFPNPEYISYDGVDSLSFENLANHAPKLRKIEIMMEQSELQAFQSLCVGSDWALQSLVELESLEKIGVRTIFSESNEPVSISLLEDCIFVAAKVQE